MAFERRRFFPQEREISVQNLLDSEIHICYLTLKLISRAYPPSVGSADKIRQKTYPSYIYEVIALVPADIFDRITRVTDAKFPPVSAHSVNTVDPDRLVVEIRIRNLPRATTL